jgi:hypothetical protein
MTAIRTFVSRRCVCGECWCGQCPRCLETVTRHNLNFLDAIANVNLHIFVAHPEKVTS